MSIFRKVGEVLRPPEPSTSPKGTPLPFGLTHPEWESLKALTSHAGWPSFLAALDETAKLLGESILHTSNDDTTRIFKGKILGLREAGVLIERARLREEAAVRDKEKREKVHARPRDVLYGSPGWRDHKRDDPARRWES